MVTDEEGLSIQSPDPGDGVGGRDEDRSRLDRDPRSRNVEVFYTVNGVRKTHKDLNRSCRGTNLRHEAPTPGCRRI
jgi:hypothetical protein